MLQVRLHALTQKSFDQFKTDLDRAVEASFAAALMTRKWSDRTLHIHTAAPTTSGVIRYEMGGVYAEFQISWPGIPMKDLIIKESRRILATATGSLVTRWP